MKALGPSLLLIGLAGCAPSLVERRVDELRSVLADAQSRGAASCAPVELALSSVHLEFAQLERREGDESRAERHLIVAEPNAKAALRRTREGDCHASAVASSGSTSPDVPAVQQADLRSRAERASNLRSTTSRPTRVADAQGHRRPER